MEEPMHCYFKEPTTMANDGTSDPFDHLENFRSLMLLQGALDVLMYKNFLTTVREVASAWYT